MESCGSGTTVRYLDVVTSPPPLETRLLAEVPSIRQYRSEMEAELICGLSDIASVARGLLFFFKVKTNGSLIWGLRLENEPN